MKITWLGQAGLLMETDDLKIMIDPYLSDSVARIQPENTRRISVEKRFLAVKPNIIVLTHNHLDHTDPETLKHYLTSTSNVLVLASKNAWQEARKFGGNNNYVMFNNRTVWSEQDIIFSAVKAEHSDEYAIGVLITCESKTYYITGDTLYNEEIFEDLPGDIDCVFLPVNGKGNNMNMRDAEKFCRRLNAKCAVPVHCGLFDNIDLNEFSYENIVVPEMFKEIKI